MSTSSKEVASEATIVDAAAAATLAAAVVLPSIVLPTLRQLLQHHLQQRLNNSSSNILRAPAGSIVVLEKRPTSVSQTAQGSSLLLLKANSRETEVGVDACELGDSLNSIITQKQ